MQQPTGPVRTVIELLDDMICARAGFILVPPCKYTWTMKIVEVSQSVPNICRDYLVQEAKPAAGTRLSCSEDSQPRGLAVSSLVSSITSLT